MRIDINTWKPFKVGRLFECSVTQALDINTAEEGPYPYITRSAENNGMAGYYGNVDVLNKGNCITIGAEGMVAFYQPTDFIAGVKIYTLRNPNLNEKNALFLVAILNKLSYLYNYGRARILEKIKDEQIVLPIKYNSDKSYLIDQSKKYSDDGYMPDWEYMSEYIETLHHKPLTTEIHNSKNGDLQTNEWKEFLLHRIFKAGMGNGIDAVLTTNDNPKYNYVSRDSNGNGVVGFVDEIEGEDPFPVGAMSLALGGSFLGSCFIQKKPFYTAQNVAVLQEKVPLTNHTKLFIATLIRNECKIKYQAFGRELNAHFRKDFTIKLPIKHDGENIVIDDTHEFSDDGYIPDWEWMDIYMKSLPYSDRI